MARQYYEDGVDELVFYDITASAEQRSIMIDVVKRVAEQIFGSAKYHTERYANLSGF